MTTQQTQENLNRWMDSFAASWEAGDIDACEMVQIAIRSSYDELSAACWQPGRRPDELLADLADLAQRYREQIAQPRPTVGLESRFWELTGRLTNHARAREWKAYRQQLANLERFVQHVAESGDTALDSRASRSLVYWTAKHDSRPKRGGQKRIQDAVSLRIDVPLRLKERVGAICADPDHGFGSQAGFFREAIQRLADEVEEK